MTRALYTAATGMQAQQLKIDVIANNLANVNTDGYKQSRAQFQDLIYQNLRVSGAGSTAAAASPIGLQVGLGVRPAATTRVFSQGSLKETFSPTDVAINGEGFLQVRDRQTGEVLYTRNGHLQIDNEGRLATVDGYLIEPPITLPSDIDRASFKIEPDGTVTVMNADKDREIDLGRLRLVRLVNPSSLHALGGNLYQHVGDPRAVQEGYPGEDNMGSIQQGFIETSNVEVVQEMISMITGQRAYEANSKVIQAADRMLEDANRLR